MWMPRIMARLFASSDSGGKVEIDGLMPGETFNVEVDPKDDDDDSDAKKKKRKR